MKYKIVIIAAGCLNLSINTRAQEKGLKDYFKNDFTIGVAVSPRALKTDEAQLILKEFNSMTPENAMKMGPIHPFENQYNWAGGDSIAAFEVPFTLSAIAITASTFWLSEK